MDILIVLLSIVSLITTLIGLYLLGEKSKHGFSIFTISLGCQFIIFYFEQKWFLVVQMIVLIIFNIRNYYKWGKENDRNNQVER